MSGWSQRGVMAVIVPVLGLLVLRAVTLHPEGSSIPAVATAELQEITNFVKEVERHTQQPPKRHAVRCGFLEDALRTERKKSLLREWRNLGCDAYRATTTTKEAEKEREATTTTKEAEEREEAPVDEEPGAGPVNEEVASRPFSKDEDEPSAECRRMMKQHDVVPGQSWGRLSREKQQRWTLLDCDRHVPRRGSKQKPKRKVRPLPRCGNESAAAAELPLVALCCGTTTRTKSGWIENPTRLDELALFRHLLPSFRRTVDCGFRYLVVVGYDVGDKFWDGRGADRGRAWFREEIAGPLRRDRDIDVQLTFARVDNTLKKPGPVFAAITALAFRERADYVYRVNDDTELVTPWAADFVRALKHLDNVGAVGPFCDQGNRKILTHDFTHRTHMQIFGEANYYPPALSDWWMDDWISGVYGPDRTLRADHVEVVHHTFHHGQRYDVDRSHAGLVDGLQAKGKRIVADYLNRYNPRLLQETKRLKETPPPDGFVKFTMGKHPAVRGSRGAGVQQQRRRRGLPGGSRRRRR